MDNAPDIFTTVLRDYSSASSLRNAEKAVEAGIQARGVESGLAVDEVLKVELVVEGPFAFLVWPQEPPQMEQPKPMGVSSLT